MPEWPTADDPFAVRGRPDGYWFGWRMLGRNNRELGRGAHVHATEALCLREAARVQAGHARATSSVGLRPNGTWWWQVELDGVPVAVASRTFQRQRECRYNLDQFLAVCAQTSRRAAPSVEIAPVKTALPVGCPR